PRPPSPLLDTTPGYHTQRVPPPSTTVLLGATAEPPARPCSFPPSLFFNLRPPISNHQFPPLPPLPCGEMEESRDEGSMVSLPLYSLPDSRRSQIPSGGMVPPHLYTPSPPHLFTPP